jgi:hypothetical protein
VGILNPEKPRMMSTMFKRMKLRPTVPANVP